MIVIFAILGLFLILWGLFCVFIVAPVRYARKKLSAVRTAKNAKFASDKWAELVLNYIENEIEIEKSETKPWKTRG